MPKEKPPRKEKTPAKKAVAKKPIAKQPPASFNNATADWKSHPVLVVGGAVAATIIAMVGIFNEMIIPNRVAKQEIEILKQKDVHGQLIARNTSLTNAIAIEKKQNSNLTQKIKKLTEQTTKLSAELLASRNSNLFQPGSPYPNGFGLVRVGMPISEVSKVYNAKYVRKAEDDMEYVSVDLQNSVFSYVTYYYEKQKKGDLITHIVFRDSVSNPLPETFIRDRLIEALGTPADHPREKYYAWPTRGPENVFMTDQDSFFIMRGDITPGLWPALK